MEDQIGFSVSIYRNSNKSLNCYEIFDFSGENGYVEVVKLLLQNNCVDPSNCSDYIIREASRNGHVEVVKFLLQDNRVDPSDSIGIASENGNIEVVKLLLQDDRVDPSRDDNYALIMASAYDYVEVVELLLQDVRVKDLC